MEVNPNYYGTKPKLKRVVWRHIAEESSQRLLLESGDVDIARNLSADQLDGLRAKGGFETTATAQNTNLYMGMNTKNQYLANPKVRQAIRYLVDYDGLVKTALREGWVINQTFLPNGVMGFVDSHPFTLDIDKAKALLAEAGYPNGFPITVNVASTEQSRMDIAQSLQETFAKVGIQLKILASDQKTVITTYRARKHDMALLTWGIDYFDPDHQHVLRGQHRQFRQAEEQAAGLAQRLDERGSQRQGRGLEDGARHRQAEGGLSGDDQGMAADLALRHDVPAELGGGAVRRR